MAGLTVVGERDGVRIWTAVTDAKGYFRTDANVAPGTYRVYVPGPYEGETVVSVVSSSAAVAVDASFRIEPQPLTSAPPPPAGRNGAPDNAAVVRVFYATNRALASASPVMFSGARHGASELTRGSFDVSIPRQHRLANIERPSIWRLEFREDPSRHFVIVERTVKPSDVFYRELAARVQRSDRKDAFVFVHGYNVGFDDAVYRTAQMAYDLGFGGAPILFSWPSNGSTLEYTGDINNSEWSIGHLKTFLAEVAANSGATSVHLIAHSMGNRVLTGALERLAADPAFAASPRFTHLVLTAPDIDADIFRQLAATIRKTASRVTLYASSNDRALQVSKRLNGYPRAGDAGAGIVVVPGVDTIDVSSVDTDFLGHSYYGDNRSVLSDLFNLIRRGVPPEQRFGLREAVQGSAKYWIFSP